MHLRSLKSIFRHQEYVRSRVCNAGSLHYGPRARRHFKYCNRTNFRTRFNFVYFVLLAESTKFSSIRKPYTYTSVSDTTAHDFTTCLLSNKFFTCFQFDTTVAVRKFPVYESRQTPEYEIFSRTKISAITVARLYFSTRYCNRRNFHTRFDFAYFVLLAESTKF